MKLLFLLLLLSPLVSVAAIPPLAHPKLKNPIVLVHGATTKGSNLDIGFLHFGEYFRLLPAFLGALELR